MINSQLYHVKLTTKSPVFVGSGGSFTKKEYLFDRNTNKVTIIDGARLMRWLVTKGGASAIDEYEKFMLNGNIFLRDFLNQSVRIPKDDEKDLCLYEADASEAISDNGNLMEIKTFMRDAFNRPYVPGSSLKGALRTAILIKMIRNDSKVPPLPYNMFGKSAAQDMERRYLHTLHKKSEDRSMLNSVMRGLSISDSAPMDQNSIALTRKIDRFRNGGENKNKLNVARESLRPGTEIHFSLAITPELSGNLSAEYIMDAVREFGEYYKKNFSDKFKHPQDHTGETFEDCIILGGGAGYFSKNIAYPGRPWDEALKKVSEAMQRNFRRHNHEKDVRIGISPRAIKYTEYRAGRSAPLHSYQVGVCHFSMEKMK